MKIKRRGEEFKFSFDALTSDPIPNIVKLLQFVAAGVNLPTNQAGGYRSAGFDFGDNDLEFKIDPDKRNLEFQIRAWHDTNNKIWLTFKIFYKQAYGKEITFADVYLRDNLKDMLKKILSNLFNDEKFPYAYPLYGRYDDVSFENFGDLAEEIVKNIPNLTDEEREHMEEKLLLQ